MIEFRRNKETGELETWKDGKKTGSIVTMGDDIMKETPKEEEPKPKKKAR